MRDYEIFQVSKIKILYRGEEYFNDYGCNIVSGDK